MARLFFVMGLGAALGAKVVGYFPNWKYKKYVILSGIGVLCAFGMTFSGNPYLMILGGSVGSFADDFLEVRTDILLNDMIPSEQRATLISVKFFYIFVGDDRDVHVDGKHYVVLFYRACALADFAVGWKPCFF